MVPRLPHLVKPYSNYGFCWLPEVEENHSLYVEVRGGRLAVLDRVREGIIGLIYTALGAHIDLIDIESGSKSTSCYLVAIRGCPDG